MRKLLITVVLALMIAPAALGATQTRPIHHHHHQQWWTHLNGDDKLVCDKGHNGVTGPFSTREACEASITDDENGGGDDGGTTGGGGTDETPPVVIVIPAGPFQTFLCYSHFGTETLPAVFDFDVALKLWAQGGYFLPVAVPGNDPSGNNVGGWHLVCNPAATRKAPGTSLNGTDDTIMSAAWVAAFKANFTPPLNLYVIYQ